MAIAIFPVLIVGLVAIGVLVLLVALLANPRTRVVGGILGGFLLILMLLAGGAAVLWVFTARVGSVRTEVQRAVRDEAQARLEAEAQRQVLDSRGASSRVELGPPGIEFTADAVEGPTVSAGAEAESTNEGRVTQPATEEPSTGAGESAGGGEEAKSAGQPETPGAAAAPRPAWVGQIAANTPTGYRTTVRLGPYTTTGELERLLPGALEASFDEYVADRFGRQWAGWIQLPPDYLSSAVDLASGYSFRRWSGQSETPPADLHHELVKGLWEETEQSSYVPVHYMYVLLEYNQRTVELMKESQQRAIVAARLWYAGTALAAVLALLAVAYAALRVDRALEGRRRGRLAAAVAVALLAVAAGAVLAVVHVDTPLSAAVPRGPQPSATVDVVPATGHYNAGDVVLAPRPQPYAEAHAGGTAVVRTAALPWITVSLLGVVLLLGLAAIGAAIWHRKSRPYGLILLAALVLGTLALLS